MEAVQDLQIYQFAVKVDLMIFKLTKSLPYKELYLRDQVRTASYLMISNIAEGCTSSSYRYNALSYFINAQASCNESRSHIKSLLHRGYCDPEEYTLLDEALDHIGKMLTLLMRKIKNPHYPAIKLLSD